MIRLPGLPYPADRLAFAADGRLVAVGRPTRHTDPQVAVWWTLAGGVEVGRREGEYLGLSQDGRFVSVRDSKAGVRVYDGEAAKPLATVRVGRGDNNWCATAVAPAGDRLFTVHGDHVYWHALPSGTELLRKPRAMAGQAHFSPGGRWAFAAGKGAVRFWDSRAKNKLLRVPVAEWGDAVVGADERTAVVGGARVTVWDLDARRPVVELTAAGPAWAVAVTPAGDRVLTGGEDGVVRVWDVAAGGEPASFDFGLALVSVLAVAPDGLTAAAGDVDGRVIVWDL